MNATTIPRHPRLPQDEFGIRVKQTLIQRGLSITQLASSLGLARTTVSIAINHPTMLHTVKARIATFLNLRLK